MIQLDKLMTGATAAGRNITFQWIKGHAGHPLNEAADTRANDAAKAFQAGKPVKAGPGLNIDHELQPSAPTSTEQREAEEAPAARVTVHTPLEKSLADEIVQRAQQRGVTPHEELARLIEAGMTAVYDTDQ